MKYVLELKPEVARLIEAEASQKGVTPEELLEKLAEKIVQTDDEARRQEIRALTEKLFDDYAPAFEALAEGAK